MLRPHLPSVLLTLAAASAVAQSVTNVPPKGPSAERPPTRFTLAEGFRMEQVAGDQLVESPAGLAFDERGRLYVAELRDVPATDPDTPLKGRIRLLEDTDQDGVFDTASVFADNFDRPGGLACSQGGVFATSDREVLYLRDQDVDGVADIRRNLFSLVGSASSEPGPMLRHLAWGPDRRIHVALGGARGRWESVTDGATPMLVGAGQEVSFHPLTLQSRMEPGGGAMAQCFDQAGERFLFHPWTGVAVAVHAAGDLERNQYAPPLPGTAVVLSGAPGRSPVAGMAYRGGRYGSNWHGALFLADPDQRAIQVLKLDGAGVHSRARAGSALVTVVTSSDPVFRPVAVVHGPDDALYIADLCRTNHLAGPQNTDPTDHIPRGRIWRLVPDTSASETRPDWSDPTALTAALGQTNAWVRETAARLMFERRATNMAPVLSRMLKQTVQPVARLEALRALDAAGTISADDLTVGLSDKDPAVRAEAARIAGRIDPRRASAAALLPQLGRLASDTSPRVRFAAAMAVGELFHAGAADTLSGLVGANAANPWMQHAALTAAARHQPRLFQRLLDQPRVLESFAGQAVLRELAVTIGLAGEPGAVTDSLAALREHSFDEAFAFQLAAALGEGSDGRGLQLPDADGAGQWVPVAGSAMSVVLDGTFEPQRVAAADVIYHCVGPHLPAGDGFLLLFAPGLPESLLPGFIRVLGREATDRDLSALTQRWQYWNGAAQSQTIDELLRTQGGRDALSMALARGVISTDRMTSTQFEVLRAMATSGQRGRLGSLLTRDRSDRSEILEAFLPATERTGNTERGRELFQQRCVLCHNATPATVGPTPAELSQLSRMQRLAGLLDPSRDLAAEHTTSTVELKDGRAMWGVVREPAPGVIHLMTPEGVQRYRTEGIAGRVGQTWSLMPDNAAEGLTLKDVTDLITFMGQAR